MAGHPLVYFAIREQLRTKKAELWQRERPQYRGPAQRKWNNWGQFNYFCGFASFR